MTQDLTALRRLLSAQNLAVLATQIQGQPYTSLVAFSFSQDLKTLYFLTDARSRKYTNLTVSKQVALLVHNAANTGDDFSQALSVTALGKARPLTAPGDEMTAFLERHPGLSGFAQSRDTAMVAVDIESFLLVSRFDQTEEIRI